MPGRFYNGTDYRYGFNGKENDKDINEGTMDYGARIYDNRLGRWFSTDPHKGAYTSQSPYGGFYNNPNIFLDGDGRDNIIYIINFSAGRPDIDINKAGNELQTAIDAIMGTDKVKVVVLQPEEYDKTKLDNTDAVIAYGDIASVKWFAGDKLNYQLYLGKGGYHEVASGDVKNLSGIIDSKITDFQSNDNFSTNKESYVKPGNSAQDWLVLTMLHTIGHQVFGSVGHTTDKLDLDFGDKFLGDLYDNIYKNNFMLDGESILNTVSRYNFWDKSYEPNKGDQLKHGLDYSLSTFKAFTFFKSNKFLFNKGFSKFFNAKTPNAKMKSAPKQTSQLRSKF